MKTNQMPILFVGHGSPMNAIEENEFSQTWRQISTSLPRPKAILVISAHWQTRGSFVTGILEHRTIHDFMGFPQELFDVEYPAQGSEWLIDQVKNAVTCTEIHLDHRWGLDHGAWSVLRVMYPKADIPVIQLSLDQTCTLDFHYSLGEDLTSLRNQGVLILGSGNIVHNLRMVDENAEPYDWAVEYDHNIRDWILSRDHDAIINYDKHEQSATLSVNSGEHYIPLLYILGASEKNDPIQFYCEQIWGGSVSMRCVQFG